MHRRPPSLSSEIVEAARGAGGEQIHTADPVPAGGAFLGRSGETVESRDDVRSLEASRRERRNELCFQQRAGNSTDRRDRSVPCGNLHTHQWLGLNVPSSAFRARISSRFMAGVATGY
jgi:hypothetical protein